MARTRHSTTPASLTNISANLRAHSRRLITQGWQQLRIHWAIVTIVILGTWLRTWHLSTHAILFSDAGRDLLVARQAIESKFIPLIGIPSSVPRFHQGPLTVWLQMLIYQLVGTQTTVYSYTFAVISILALVVTYEVAVLHLNRPTALIATLFLAISPLAVAHARVPYHITPIPLMMIIFLWTLIRLWEKKPLAGFWATFCWALLMQFELALFGLLLVIGWISWQRRYSLNRWFIGQLTAAGLVGFAPQIIYDLTHPISQSQLAAFFGWVGYRLISLTGITGEHQFSQRHLQQTTQAFWCSTATS